MLSSTPSQLPFNKTIDKTPRKILSPIQGSALEPLLDLTTESEHFESADEGDIIGDENCHPVTSEFVNRNKTGEKINIKTEFISEISNEDKQEIALLKLTLMQYEKLLISMETSDRNRHLKKDMK